MEEMEAARKEGSSSGALETAVPAAPQSSASSSIDAGERLEDEPREILASRLIDAWCDSHGGQISWVKAVNIAAIVTKMPENERIRMLALNEEDHPFGLVQRLRNGGQPDLANLAETLEIALQELIAKADASDDSQYGTLSTTFVREICTNALAVAHGNKALQGICA